MHTQNFVVLALPTLAGGGARIGSAVSRKVGPAVLRNRLRRWIKETFRRQALPAVDVVVIAKPSASAVDGLGAMRAELEPAFERAAKLAMRPA